MIKFYGTAVYIVSVSCVMMHAGETPASAFALANNAQIAAMWKAGQSASIMQVPLQASPRKRSNPFKNLFGSDRKGGKSQEYQAHMEKDATEADGSLGSSSLERVKTEDDSQTDPVECTKNYSPSFEARSFFTQFLHTRNTKDRDELVQLFHAKPNVDKAQREEHPHEYYQEKVTCEKKTLLLTLLEFTHQKVQADLKDQRIKFEQILQEERQRAAMQYAEVDKRATVQEQAISSLTQQLAQEKQNKEELKKAYQDIHKINFALLGLTGVSIAALVLVANKAISTAKIASSPAAPQTGYTSS